MNLYEIAQSLIDTIDMEVDTETGEILEGQQLDDAINNLQMKLDDKLENIACYIKNLKSDADQLKQEKDNLAQRQKTIENKAQRLTDYLGNFMQGNNIPTFETPKCKVSFRKSSSVNIKDINQIPKEYIKEKVEVNVDKTELKKYLKTHECNGAEIVENQNIQIK